MGVKDFSAVDKTEVANGGYYGLRYEVLTMPLIKAVQELNKKIQDLEEALMDLRQANAAKSGYTDEKAELFQNTPNPFSTATTIRYKLPLSVKQAVLNIYDMSGKPVKSMTLSVGQNEVRFEPKALAAGMYIYTLIADNKEIATKRMILTQN